MKDKTFMALAWAIVLTLGFVGLVSAATKQFETSDDVQVRVFGTLDTNQEVSCPSGGSARNATAFALHKVIRVSCKGDVRLKFGSSSVTAAATDAFLAATVPEYFANTSNTHLACYGDGAAATCTFTEMKAPTE